MQILEDASTRDKNINMLRCTKLCSKLFAGGSFLSPKSDQSRTCECRISNKDRKDCDNTQHFEEEKNGANSTIF